MITDGQHLLGTWTWSDSGQRALFTFSPVAQPSEYEALIVLRSALDELGYRGAGWWVENFGLSSETRVVAMRLRRPTALQAMSESLAQFEQNS